jgi:type II secretory pathway pseudopilin PulG
MAGGRPADTTGVIRRMRHEAGFGMLELLIALVILNVGLFALVGVFNASTASIGRARGVTAATAVADKQMELYRGMTNCAIWLDQWLMPASGTAYANDTSSFNGSSGFSPQVPYWSTSTAADQQYWVTDGMDAGNFKSQTNLASCAYTGQATSATLPLTSTTGSSANLGSLNAVTPAVSSTTCGTSATQPCAVKPTQSIVGPDGQTYTVYTYIILVQPTNGEWTKQVTVVVRDPRNSNRILARESAVFDPTAGH